MKLITRNTDYAIRALCYIARHDKTVLSVSELVSVLKVPRPFLRKALQTLNKKGLLRSYKGKGGGFVLAVLPEKIFLIDLIRILQGRFKLSECFFKKHVCPDIKTCPLKKKLEKLEKLVVRELGSITIKSLLEVKSK